MLDERLQTLSLWALPPKRQAVTGQTPLGAARGSLGGSACLVRGVTPANKAVLRCAGPVARLGLRHMPLARHVANRQPLDDIRIALADI